MGFQDLEDWWSFCSEVSGSADHTAPGCPTPQVGSLIPCGGSLMGSHVPPLRGDRSSHPHSWKSQVAW